jgi:thiamine pyrophosphokinase
MIENAKYDLDVCDVPAFKTYGSNEFEDGKDIIIRLNNGIVAAIYSI